MNFSGRYWTANGTLVAVHLVESDDILSKGIWKGHTLHKGIETANYVWDKDGTTLDHSLDLVRAVNPEKEAEEYGRDWDCEECREWLGGRR